MNIETNARDYMAALHEQYVQQVGADKALSYEQWIALPETPEEKATQVVAVEYPEHRINNGWTLLPNAPFIGTYYANTPQKFVYLGDPVIAMKKACLMTFARKKEADEFWKYHF